MKIYTMTGDRGETSLFGGKRVPKDALRIEAYGTVDELNSALGVARGWKTSAELDKILNQIQNELFVLGADLATPVEKRSADVQRLGPEQVSSLERIIDSLEEHLKPLSSFIVPGGSQFAAQVHLARTVCRRAERCVVRLSHEEEIDPPCTVYLNRLSDLLFVLARYANQLDGVKETPWVAKQKG
jgi:cob(I)alamin adenosyltransferase